MKRIALFLLTNMAVLAVINITLRILGVDRVLDQSVLPEKIAAFGISGGSSFSRLFMTHPPLDVRIAALRAGV